MFVAASQCVVRVVLELQVSDVSGLNTLSTLDPLVPIISVDSDGLVVLNEVSFECIDIFGNCSEWNPIDISNVCI